MNSPYLHALAAELPTRVALVSDVSALPEGPGRAAARVGLESAATFLHHHSGLEITPLPVDTRQTALPDAVAALSPGFAAVCLHHTRDDHTGAVRSIRLPGRAIPVLDTGDDATAVTVAAALLNATRNAGIPLPGCRVLVIDANAAPGIGPLLTAAGVRHLTFADSRWPIDASPSDAEIYDVMVDLSVTQPTAPAPVGVPPRITLATNSAAPSSEPAAIVATGRPGPDQLHPLLALPGLLSAVVKRHVAIDVGHRLSAAHALAGLAGPGQLLPDALDTRIAATVHAAVTAPPSPRRPQ